MSPASISITETNWRAHVGEPVAGTTDFLEPRERASHIRHQRDPRRFELDGLELIKNEANNLNQTAIIDCRGPNPGLFHDAYRAFAVRARLDRAHGTHANQLIWEGPSTIEGDTDCELNSFLAMDRWLGRVERDHSRRKPSRRRSSATSRPISPTSAGTAPATSCPTACARPAYVNVEGTPRMVAGDAITTDANKCQLKPLRHSDFPGITFTNAEWTKLEQTFPKGVCDFSQPGVNQQPTIAWLTYQDNHGHVI